jgi:hypothetical protein
MSARLRRLRAPSLVVIASVVMLSGATCTGMTSPDGDIGGHRARWQAQRITTYQFDFHQSGFFIACTGPSVRVHVTAGVVDAATDLATGQPVSPLTCWPTIDQLFDRAAQAEQANSLTAIRYDPALDYPTHIEIAGPPDASGSYSVFNLQPAP